MEMKHLKVKSYVGIRIIRALCCGIKRIINILFNDSIYFAYLYRNIKISQKLRLLFLIISTYIFVCVCVCVYLRELVVFFFVFIIIISL